MGLLQPAKIDEFDSYRAGMMIAMAKRGKKPQDEKRLKTGLKKQTRVMPVFEGPLAERIVHPSQSGNQSILSAAFYAYSEDAAYERIMELRAEKMMLLAREYGYKKPLLRDWIDIFAAVMTDFLPGLQVEPIASNAGRPKLSETRLHEVFSAVEELVLTGKSVTSACKILVGRKRLFEGEEPETIRKIYYTAHKRLGVEAADQ